MSKCSLCQQDNIGFMAGFTMSGLPGKVCSLCHDKIIASRKTGSDYNSIICYFTELLNQTSDSVVHDYLVQLINNTKETAATNEDIKFQRNLSDANQAEILSVLVSTTENITGYEITEYKNVVSGIAVLGTGFLSELNLGLADIVGSNSSLMESKINQVQELAIYQLKQKAHDICCNAVIGISFSFVPFSGNAVGLIATGTSVIIKQRLL